MTRQTLLNYEKWELIDQPQRGGGGTGGFWTDYSKLAVIQASAASMLLNGTLEPAIGSFLTGKPLKFAPGPLRQIRTMALKSGIDRNKALSTKVEDVHIEFGEPHPSYPMQGFIRSSVLLYLVAMSYAQGVYIARVQNGIINVDNEGRFRSWD